MAKDPFFEDRGAARPMGLALWARQRSGITDPPTNLGAALNYFDLDIAIAEDLPRASRLAVHEGRLRIEVRDSSDNQQRFNASHELGHALLAMTAAVSFQRQAADPRFESYCNRFASHLLLPRPWLRDRVDAAPVSLTTALDIAREAGVSLLNVVVALNESCNWSRVAVMWKRGTGRSWMPSTVIGPRTCGIVSSARDTDQLLSQVGSSTTSFDLPLTVGGHRRNVPAEAISIGRRCFSVFPISAVM